MEKTKTAEYIKTLSLDGFKAAINAVGCKLEARTSPNKDGSISRGLYHQGVNVCYLAANLDPTKDVAILEYRDLKKGTHFFYGTNVKETTPLGFEL